MKRFATVLALTALAAGACSNPPANTAPVGEIQFTLTFDFDSTAADPNVWNRGTFTTAGHLSRAFIDGLTAAPTYTGSLWTSSGDQTFGDWKCTTPDECLEPCTGSYGRVAWQDKPQIGLVSRNGAKVVLSALLSPDPKPDADEFLQTPDCPPTTGGGVDGFPPMKITIDGLGTGGPLAMSVAYAPYSGTEPPAPGQILKLTITPSP
jgi:hypothetical protein